ncbi:MAG: phosphoglucosamine mutase [Clostridia bacterium]|nr:phosphoglucosamine mutase [Clostridia bacterium]
MGRLFGTDGVRGIANKELTCELTMKIGAAGAYVLTNGMHAPRILVGCDTRKSGDMLAAALSAGICSVGGEVMQLGVLPTPAMAYLVRMYDADAAVMISASHNPMEYNGIKWFNGDGYKLSDDLEDQIEAIIRDGSELPAPVGPGVGHILNARRAEEEYKEFLISTAETRFDGLRIVLDCANGASSAIAKDVFTRFGAEVLSYGDEPDGYNINDRCGSTYPQKMQQLMLELGADVGFAFDGDADRVIAADERGEIVDGDTIMGICALSMKEHGTLKQDTLVITVMSNLGLKQKMKENGIHVEETVVGDRYVLENMLKNGYNLGGEQSGHMIFLDKNTTGDGMLSAIQLLNVLKKSGKRLSALADEIPIYPQTLLNIIVDNDKKAAALADEEMHKKIKEVESILGDQGRVLVRASGTEPLIRIMLEGKNENEIEKLALSIAEPLLKNEGGRIKGR